MFRIDVLVNHEWKYLYENDNIYLINESVKKALKEGYQIRVLENNIVLAFLNNILEYDYWLMLIECDYKRR